MFALVNGGFTNKGYDGKAFFATNHKVGKKNVSNKGTAALEGDTLANAKASFGAARTAMLKQTDEEGRPLGVKPNVLLVPSALVRHGDGADDGGASRGRQGQHLQGRRGRSLHSQWLTSDKAWYLLDTMKPIKPFIYQERTKPEFVQQTDIHSDAVYMRKQFRFGVECRANGGYGFWQMAYGSDGSE